MNNEEKPSAKTAAVTGSIWKDIPEDTFRQHLVTLEERTNAVPIKPWVVSESGSTVDALRPTDVYALSTAEEQKLADDFAYIAAVGEGAQSVAAVCIEEKTSSIGMRIRLAAADAVSSTVRSYLEEVGQLLMSSSISSDPNTAVSYVESLLATIIKLHHDKLLGRLRSCRWRKPKYLSRTHKKPLWQDLDNLLHRVQHVYLKKNNPKGKLVSKELLEIQIVLKELESMPDGHEYDIPGLQKIVHGCYEFCHSPNIREFASRLATSSSLTDPVAAGIKALQQIEKIGACRRIAMDMVARARRYPSLFQHIDFEYMQPYSNLPTDIGYERWAKTVHVHAEIQLIIHYDIINPTDDQQDCKAPRAIGTSKYLCYLCFLFMTYHGRFQPANTHGRLYDQWTIPDLEEYSDTTLQRLRDVISLMDTEVTRLADDIGPRQGKREAWRFEPMTSRQNLLHLEAEETALTQENTAVQTDCKGES